MGRVGFDPRTFPPWHSRSPVSHPTCHVPFPPRRPGECRKGMIPPARCTRGSGDRFGIPKPRESGSVIGVDRRRTGPSCVLPKGVPQGQTESGGIVLAAICWATSAKRRCHPTRGVVLTDFSHLLIVNKLFSRARALSLPSLSSDPPSPYFSPPSLPPPLPPPSLPPSLFYLSLSPSLSSLTPPSLSLLLSLLLILLLSLSSPLLPSLPPPLCLPTTLPLSRTHSLPPSLSLSSQLSLSSLYPSSLAGISGLRSTARHALESYVPSCLGFRV